MSPERPRGVSTGIIIVCASRTPLRFSSAFPSVSVLEANDVVDLGRRHLDNPDIRQGHQPVDKAGRDPDRASGGQG